jgi:hypothetical protein
MLVLSMALLPVEAQSALQLIEGNWMVNPKFGCNLPFRVIVFNNKIQFYAPQPDGSGYFTVVETVTAIQSSSIDTIIESSTNPADPKGSKYRYLVSDDKLLIHNYQTGEDSILTRCK